MLNGRYSFKRLAINIILNYTEPSKFIKDNNSFNIETENMSTLSTPTVLINNRYCQLIHYQSLLLIKESEIVGTKTL